MENTDHQKPEKISSYENPDYGNAEIGPHKLRLPKTADREMLIQFRKRLLYRVLNQKTAIAFVGSGLSIPLKYPSWEKLTKDIVLRTQDIIRDSKEIPSDDRRTRLERFLTQLDGESKSEDGVATKRLIFMLGECQRLLKTHTASDRSRARESDLTAYLKSQFAPPGVVGIPAPYDEDYEARSLSGIDFQEN